jgi:tetratricopeptide (TPR) repeat protein
MNKPARFVGIACIFLLCLALAMAIPALAQEADSDQAAKEEAKERARQARIEEYLRKKEERRARREMQRAQKAAQEEAAAEEPAEVVVPAPAEAGIEAKDDSEAEMPRKKDKKKKPREKKQEPERIYMPRGLARVQESLREDSIGQDPTVRAYLDLIDRGEASPQQLAAFGNFLSQNGRTRDAMEYYAVALGMEGNDPVLWMNVGTLHRKLQEFSMAAKAYGRALSIEPTNAFAHYNLGSVLDEMGRYEEAIAEYKEALTLDPTLGDPSYNPQAANNEKLLAVKLMLYRQQVGTLGLPLVEVPGGGLEAGEEKREAEPGR